MTILGEIAARTRERISEEKARIPLSAIRDKAESSVREPFLFERNLRREGLSVIAEVKKASPSKGLIAEDFHYLEIAREYECAGADCISCLTEPFYFLGSDSYLERIAASVSIPVLRKDFTIDPYMIYQAKAMGADAVLLILSLLPDSELMEYLALASQLGLSAIAECHTASEIERALSAGAGIIGVNSRDLADFSVDIRAAGSLLSQIPPSVLIVAESGISDESDARFLEEAGADAVLVGEMLMKAQDRKAALRRLKGI